MKNREISKPLNSKQQKFLEDLIRRYTEKTARSKQQAQRYRRVLADRRSTVGFRLETKEMVYPIVGDRFDGCKFWDIDGNEYIDLGMGFGTHLFGHRAPFIVQALKDGIEGGVQIGPQAKLAGEVAELICEMTGMERACFCNSGTEAVMTAMRLARAATGRDKIALFKGSYHGHFDGTLAKSAKEDENLEGKAAPMVPGVLQHMVDDVLVLNYGDRQSLDLIKANAGELAGVLVEPVQSRFPHIQPKAYLQELRQLTQESGIPLIFDEIITGFRIHPGGAQAWFGVEADLVTYGKLVGGGMPIGVVAGKSRYLDAIDGGNWNYGDDSYPQVKKTFHGGTFCKHPLAMGTAIAVLRYLKEQGGGLQETLNQRTADFSMTVNDLFSKLALPLKIVCFSSLFRLAVVANSSINVYLPKLFQPLELDLLFYSLILKGIYIIEPRFGFISTAHTKEDIDSIFLAIKETVAELQEGGFFR